MQPADFTVVQIAEENVLVSINEDILGSENSIYSRFSKMFHVWYKLNKCNRTLIPKFVFCESLNF